MPFMVPDSSHWYLLLISIPVPVILFPLLICFTGLFANSWLLIPDTGSCLILLSCMLGALFLAPVAGF